jgi:hypothetical protein
VKASSGAGPAAGQGLDGSDNIVRHRLNERGLIEPTSNLAERGNRADLICLNLCDRVIQVLSVLSTSRIGRVATRHHNCRVQDPIGTHLRECIAEERIPVPIAPVHGEEIRRVSRDPHVEVCLQRFTQSSSLCVDGRHATKGLILLCDCGESFSWDSAARRDALKKRHDVLGCLWAAKGQEQHGIK